jgi:uncharacterized membrane protein YbhN (UPF0104 family)
MRYFIQLLIPALIFVGTVYLLTRQRRRDGTGSESAAQPAGSDTVAFIVILALGAVVALGIAFVLQSLLD